MMSVLGVMRNFSSGPPRGRLKYGNTMWPCRCGKQLLGIRQLSSTPIMFLEINDDHCYYSSCYYHYLHVCLTLIFAVVILIVTRTHVHDGFSKGLLQGVVVSSGPVLENQCDHVVVVCSSWGVASSAAHPKCHVRHQRVVQVCLQGPCTHA